MFSFLRTFYYTDRVASVQEAIDAMISNDRNQQNAMECTTTKRPSTSMTVIIVAHRLSTIQNSYIIFVVKDGNVVEQGNHKDLLEIPNGVYTNLVSRQMKAPQQQSSL